MNLNTNSTSLTANQQKSSKPESRKWPISRLANAALVVGATALAVAVLKQKEPDQPQQFEVPRAELQAMENLTDQQIMEMGIGRYLVFRAGDGENLRTLSARIDGAISSPGSDPSLDSVIDEVREQAIAHDGTAGFDEGERFIVNSPPKGPVIIP